MMNATEPIAKIFNQRLRKKAGDLNAYMPSLDQLVSHIIRDCGNAAKVLELYYWSQQPGFIEAARALSGLDPKTRGILQSFLTMGNPSMISVSVGEFGYVHLQSDDVQEVMHKMRADEPPI
jgi:hypothetical protein